MKADVAKKLLKAGYSGKKKNVDNYTIDKSLSGKRVQVYRDNDTNKTVVVHRGTASLKDWVTDAGMAVGYEGGKRFKHSKKIQKEAEKKYGKDSITTLGHSLGGRLAEKYHKGKGDVITFNKAATPKSIKRKTPGNQYDVRTKNDVVSVLSKHQKHTNKVKTINAHTINPLKAHSTDQLKHLNDQVIGSKKRGGHIRKSGIYKLHNGEYVLPSKEMNCLQK